MSQWWKRLKNLILLGRAKSYEELKVSAQSNGIVIEELRQSKADKSITLPWNQVSQIVGYRRDVFVGNHISLSIELSDSRVIELDESMQGWENLLKALSDYLPQTLSQEEMFLKIMAAQNLSSPVIIFSRK